MPYITSPVDAVWRPLRVAVELDDRTGAAYWADLTVGADGAGPLDLGVDPPSVIRVRASDLREARRIRDRIRDEASEDGRDPDSLTVLVDIDVVVDHDARVARRRAQSEWRHRGGVDSLSYVGTPKGLAGLLADIHAVRVADGVTLVSSPVPFALEHLVDGTLPMLRARGLLDVSPAVGELRRRFAHVGTTAALAS
ncbi:hypothetical protein [Rhodococcus yananensis]|uniref:hypothetical protein n=1 Tax=Rhodococcus yananensis TaxID=2879464 RepID=UPI001CF7F080|nr:hypothetical protein [Rhodococcus yananensis]